MRGRRVKTRDPLLPRSKQNYSTLDFGLLFAVSSHCGRMFISPTSSPNMLPDPEILVECLR
jgi:hypothetical protein